MDIPIKPAEAPDGTGRIGVQLAANAQFSRIISKDPLQAVQLASKQFAKLTTTVVTGQQQACAFSCPHFDLPWLNISASQLLHVCNLAEHSPALTHNPTVFFVIFIGYGTHMCLLYDAMFCSRCSSCLHA